MASIFVGRNIIPIAVISIICFIRRTHQITHFSTIKVAIEQTSPIKKKITSGRHLTVSIILAITIIVNLLRLFSRTVTITTCLGFNVIVAFGIWWLLISEWSIYKPAIFLINNTLKLTRSLIRVYTRILEFIGVNVRWITLSIRLRANVVVGHVFVALINIFLSATFVIFFIAFYIRFETIIYSVQAIIYTLLISSY